MITFFDYAGVNVKPMDWGDSIAFCEKQIAKNATHGHKMPFRAGDKVRCPAGEGTLVFKEWLYFSAELNRDVWFLKVLIRSEEHIYNDAGVISVV